MEIDQEYLEYVGQSSLALLAISFAYFLDLSNPVSLGVLVMIPLLYGYTTYISRDSFRPASLLSLVTLIFVPIGTTIGFLAVFIPISNILISLFASGTGFKNYSNATLLPMIFSGLILGSVAFGAAQTQPEVRNEIVTTFEDVSNKQTQIITDQMNLDQIMEESSVEIVNTTSRNTILLTEGYVLNNTDLDPESSRQVRDAFDGAENEVPGRLAERVSERQDSLDISDNASRAAGNLIEANLGIVILIAALTFYVLNPLISILTAISALAFQKLDEQL